MRTLIYGDSRWQNTYRKLNPVTVDRMVDQMYGLPHRTDTSTYPSLAGFAKHKGPMKGVPPWFDWAEGAVRHQWTFPANSSFQPWIQVVEDANGNPERRARLEVGYWRLAFADSPTSSWVDVGMYSAQLDGAYWIVEDTTVLGGSNTARYDPVASFRNPYQPNADVFSVDLEPLGDPMHNLVHAYPHQLPRYHIPASATVSHVSCHMRIQPLEPGVDLSNSRYLANCSGDYWSDDAHDTDHVGAVIGTTGYASVDYLTTDWKYFSYTTGMTAEQLTANPPPTVGFVRALTAPRARL